MSLGIYIHIPFCAAKCRYCDFNSHTSDAEERKLYVSALCDEIKSFENPDMQVDTIYFGGGTPTILEPEQLAKILGTVYEKFSVDKNCEITTECNPATMGAEGFKILRTAGFNRISIGLQSANDDELKTLGRIHSAEDCKSCVADARLAGFENLSLDLMFGLPGQTAESWKNSLKTAAELAPEHISCYGLRIEEGTPFFSMDFRVDEDLSRDMYDECVEYLGRNGYNIYEISNFAKRGYESRHNLKYWRCDDFAGFGAGAYSCVGGVRYSNVCDTNEYVNRKNKVEERVILSETDKMGEFVFLGLRMTEGVSESEFKARFNRDIREVYQKETEKNLSRGTLVFESGHLKIPQKYMYVSNSIMVDFV